MMNLREIRRSDAPKVIEFIVKNMGGNPVAKKRFFDECLLVWRADTGTFSKMMAN